MPSPLKHMCLQAVEAQWRAADAVIIFFCCYLMARYSAFLTTEELHEVTLERSITEAGIAFDVAAVASLISVARCPFSSKVAVNVAIVFLTGLLAGAGNFCGIIGVTSITAGLICAGLAVLCTFQVVDCFSGTMGGMAGAVLTSNFIGDENTADGILGGIIVSAQVIVVVVLVTWIISRIVIHVIMAFTNRYKISANIFLIAIPSAIIRGSVAGITVWLVETYVFEALNYLTDNPTAPYVFGAIFEFAVTYSLAVHLGYFPNFVWRSRPKHKTLRWTRGILRH